MLMASSGDHLGCGIACTTGFPLVMRLCWGEENLQNAAIRRLNADEACLAYIGDDPNYGYNLVKQLNKSFDRTQPGALAAVGSQVRAELEKDERLNSVTARVVSGQDNDAQAGLLVFVEGESSAGPFALVAGVGEMTVERINRGLPGASATQEIT
jgi:hypothetical protein